jgi:hypothetical protein
MAMVMEIPIAEILAQRIGARSRLVSVDVGSQILTPTVTAPKTVGTVVPVTLGKL